MDKLVPAFQESIFDPNITDLCLDASEIGIDTLLDNIFNGGVLEEIPIVKTLVGIGKTTQNIRERNLIRQTIQFINTFNAGSITADYLESVKKRFSENPKFAEEELGRILIILDSTIDLKKSELLAKFYKSYIHQRIDWQDFCEYSEVITRLFIRDLAVLFDIYTGEVTETGQCNRYQVDRLISLGLLNSTPSTIGTSFSNYYVKTNAFGNIFCTIAFI